MFQEVNLELTFGQSRIGLGRPCFHLGAHNPSSHRETQDINSFKLLVQVSYRAQDNIKLEYIILYELICLFCCLHFYRDLVSSVYKAAQLVFNNWILRFFRKNLILGLFFDSWQPFHSAAKEKIGSLVSVE